METQRKRNGPLLLAVLFTAACLRSPITGVGSLTDPLRADLGLSGSLTGFLTTIPVLTFALVSPLAVRLAERKGVRRVLAAAMGLVAAGAAVRSWLGTAGLLAGTVIIGAGIAAGNVLLPVVVKARWPDRIGPMTGLYTSAQSILAGLASALCVPVSRLAGFGWQGALAIWAAPAVAAGVLWCLPGDPAARAAGASGGAAVLRSRIAWYCTLYMGTQAFVFYSVSAWLPALLARKGVDAAAAGYIASLYQLLGILSNFAAPLLAARMKDQRLLTGAVGGIYLAGALLLWQSVRPGVLTLGVILCGFATGCAFSLCMALIGMRTRTAADASRLSGMLQSVGYAIAAAGPVITGRVLDVTGSWDALMLCLLIGIAVNTVCGQLAGRPGFVE